MIERGPWRFEREEDLDEALRQRGRTGFEGALQTAELIQFADACQRWAKTGHRNLPDYLAQRCGIAYRSYRRALALVEALDIVPEEHRGACRAMLIAMGSHRAGALTPWIRERGPAVTPQDLKPWMDLAEIATEEAFQEQVTEVRGLPVGRRGEDPGRRFLRQTLAFVPPDARDWVTAVFQAGMAAADTTNTLAVFLLMVDRFAADLRHQGVEIRGY